MSAPRPKDIFMLLSADDLRGVYESLPMATCVIDRSLVFLAASERYAQLMRTPLESLLGRSMIGLNPPQHIENAQRDFRTFDRDGRVPDHEIRLWDGIYFVSVSAVGSTRPTTAISVTLVNITQHVGLQRELAITIDEMAQAQTAIALLAHSDALTGLANRRSLDGALTRLLGRHDTASPGLAVLMIDVDCFKTYNDTYGHQAGDDALRRIAHVLHALREGPEDVAARFGGEEFIVLLPARTAHAARQLAERIRCAVLDLGILHPGSAQGRVSVSIGVAHQGDIAASDAPALGQALIAAADAALYAAKREGRNRVCTAA